MGNRARPRVVAAALAATLVVALTPLVPATPAGASSGWDPRVAPIAREVERIRHLEFEQPVEVHLMTPSAFEARVRRQSAGGVATRQRHLERIIQRSLAALGVVPPGTDLAATRDESVGSGLLGYFDGREVYVRGNRLSPLVRVITAHELTHALQAQHFMLADIHDAPAIAAHVALREGDAEWVGNEYYFRDLSEQQRREYDRRYRSIVVDIQRRMAAASIPPFLSFYTAAPYLFGYRYASAAVARGDTGALDALWDLPGPTSDIGIVNLLRKPRATVDRVARPPVHADERRRGGTFRSGAITLFQVLATRIEPIVALRAADEWNGDAAVLLDINGDDCVRTRYHGRTPEGTAIIADALQAWADVKGNVEIAHDDGLVVTSCTGAGAAPVSKKTLQVASWAVGLRQRLVVNSIKARADRAQTECLVDTFFADERLMPTLERLDLLANQLPPDLQALVDELREVAKTRCGFDAGDIGKPLTQS